MSTSVSIIMTPWNRTALLANTLRSIQIQNYPALQIIVVEDNPGDASTESLCRENRIEYARRIRGQHNTWTNPAQLLNHGIRKATGDIIIFQNAECKYETRTGIADLIVPVEADPMLTAVPYVQALNPDGTFKEWYMHDQGYRAGWISYFCQAIRRDAVMAIQGFDETYRGYGYEDDDFELRLIKHGVKSRYMPHVLVSHQWHPQFVYNGGEHDREQIFFRNRNAIHAGTRPIVANLGTEWGKL